MEIKYFSGTKFSDGKYLKIKAVFLIEIYGKPSYFVFSIKK